MQSSILNGSASTTDSAPATPPLVVFAGGGSGGHLFPALAIAERLAEIEPTAEALFLCSDRRIDESILSAAEVEFVALSARPLALRPFPKAPAKFVRGWRHAVRQVKTEATARSAPSRPTVFALMGGFVAAPAARAARQLGLPAVLVNLDVVPGKANRLIARLASRIVSAVPCPDYPRFSKQVVGMPIRRQAIADQKPPECRARLDLDPQRPTLLVTGASQGAGTFNRLLIDLVRTKPESFARWQILHLTGELDFDEVRQAYSRSNVRARVLPFCSDMAAAWGAADLALSRCGASSVAEAIANRVPTLFSPYPWHRDQHQRLNAIDHVRDGRAWIIDDAIDPVENLETMGVRLIELLENGSEREGVRSRLANVDGGDAAAEIARLLLAEAAGAIRA